MPENDLDTEPQHVAQRRNRRPKLFIVGALLVIAAAITTVLVLADGTEDTTPPTATSAAPAPQAPAGSDVVTEFSGKGNGETDEFNVESGWEIRWETTGKNLELAVTAPDKEAHAVLRFTDGPGGGTTRPVASGTVRLKVKADGAWSLIIINHAHDG